MHSAEIVVGKPQGQVGMMINPLLRKCVCEPRIASGDNWAAAPAIPFTIMHPTVVHGTLLQNPPRWGEFEKSVILAPGLWAFTGDRFLRYDGDYEGAKPIDSIPVEIKR